VSLFVLVMDLKLPVIGWALAACCLFTVINSQKKHCTMTQMCTIAKQVNESTFFVQESQKHYNQTICYKNLVNCFSLHIWGKVQLVVFIWHDHDHHNEIQKQNIDSTAITHEHTHNTLYSVTAIMYKHATHCSV
jgi:hypothetical protein